MCQQTQIYCKLKHDTANANQINTSYSEAVSMCPLTFIYLLHAKTRPAKQIARHLFCGRTRMFYP